MNRKAFLIESSTIKRDPPVADLPGARVDVRNWKAHLQSNHGGGWTENEIEILRHPTKSYLKARLLLEKTTDYVFITFSGHGFHFRGKELDDSLICLNDNVSDDIPVTEINPGNPRCTVVVDSCREVVFEKMARVESFRESLIALNADRSDLRLRYRAVFDAAVMQAGSGVIRMFACNIDETADESASSGGLYTRSLIDCCSEWHDRTASGQPFYYPTLEAHQCATQKTTGRQPQQAPQYEGGRRMHHFPLAVKV